MQAENLTQEERTEMSAACYRCTRPPVEETTKYPMVVEIDVFSRVWWHDLGAAVLSRQASFLEEKEGVIDSNPPPASEGSLDQVPTAETDRED